MRRNYGCRVTENIKLCNMDALVLENEKLRVTILLDKGSDIIELLYKPKDIDFMWCSPVELHDISNHIVTTGSSLHNYLDNNFGGWQEIFPNGGPEDTYKGCLLGMHGEASIVPWKYDIIKNDINEIKIRLSVTLLRSPFKLEKYITLKQNESNIYFDEKLTNMAAEEMFLMWGHHPTLGLGFIDESCIIETSAKKIITDGPQKDFENQRLEASAEYSWPHKFENGIELNKMPSIDEKVADLFYLKDFSGNAFYRIRNRNKKLSFELNWDSNVMPYAWVWLVAGGSFGYPWYGNTYSLAIEPWTSYPSKGISKAIENGTAMKLKAGEYRDFRMTLKISEIIS
ncbi:MAG: aldose 1-epimerase [Proteocatella sp.]